MEFPDFLQEIVTTMPAKCNGCASQCELAKELVDLLVSKHNAEHLGTVLVGAESQEIDSLIESAVPEDYAEKAKSDLRKAVGQDMEDLDDKIEDKKAIIAGNAAACSGVLKMRAQKSGVTYTVNVCTSARVNVMGKEQHLPTHIIAK